MPKIKSLKAREIIDSRGNPTVECDLSFENNFGRASVPSGASTGIHEALELRDQDKNRFNGKGVIKDIENINKIIASKIVGKEFTNIETFDETLLKIDGTENKSNLGANATLATSLAFAKCLASYQNKDFYNFLSNSNKMTLPVPMMNIINGGSHADNDVDIQEFILLLLAQINFQKLLDGVVKFFTLKILLKSKNLNTNVGDEGGFAPNINTQVKLLKQF